MGAEAAGEAAVVQNAEPEAAMEAAISADGGLGAKAEQAPAAAAAVAAAAAAEASDSESDDDLQVIVNDEDFFYPHGHAEGAEEGAAVEELYDEHYEEVDWTAELNYHHSQFKYVRPGTSPGVPDGTTASAPQSAGRAQMPFMPPYMMGQWGMQFQPCYEFVLPPSKTVFDIDLDQFEEKPWEYPGIDITDYFNFGFNEETWKLYCEDLAKLHLETSSKGKHRSYENGRQDYSQRPRSQGSRGIRNQVDGGRPSELRRHRMRATGSIIQDELEDENSKDGFRRRQKNEDFTMPYAQRRRDMSRIREPSTPHADTRRNEIDEPYNSSGGGHPQTYPGRRVPHVSSQGYASARLSDASGRPWRRLSIGGRRNMSEEFDDDDRNYESSESKESYREHSDDEYNSRRSHQSERISNQVSLRRHGRLHDERRSYEDEDKFSTTPAFETRRVISSGHYRDATARRGLSERKASPPLRDPVTERLSERRRSWQLLSEKRLGRLPSESEAQTAVDSPESVKRPLADRKSDLLSERRAQLDSARKATRSAAADRPPEPMRKTRAELIAERRAAQSIARKKLEEERSLEAAAAAAKSIAEENPPPVIEVKTSVKTSVVTTIKKMDAPARGKRESTKDDLRMKVLERVSARWKMHLRMDDAQAKRKRDSSSKGMEKSERQDDCEAQNLETATSEALDEQQEAGQIDEEQAERLDSRKQRKRKEKPERKHRNESHRNYAEDYEDGDYERGDERWQMDDEDENYDYYSRSQRGTRDANDYNKYEDDDDDEAGEVVASRKRSSSGGHSRSRSRRRRGFSPVYDEEEGEDGNYDDQADHWEGDRWHSYEDEASQRSSKRRKYYRDDEAGSTGRMQYDGYEDDYDHVREDYYRDGSVSPAEDDYDYRNRRRAYDDDNKAGRWTGSLDESDDGYGQYE